jgi:hypothetical protein
MDNRSTWKPKGRAGRFHIWHAGKNLYFVTDGAAGPVVGQREHYGSAFSLAHYHERLAAYQS